MRCEVIGRANDDELSRAFQEVKPAPVHLGDQGGPPDLALHVAHGAPHDATGLRGLGAEQVMKERRVGCRETGRAQLHLFQSRR